MQTVYVVTQGSYSDYSIVGLFSTREKAQSFVDANGGDIQEWVLDVLVGWVKRTRYCVTIKTLDGAIIWESSYEAVAPPNARSGAIQQGEGCLIVTSLVSKEHARKLAVEARQEKIRKDAKSIS